MRLFVCDPGGAKTMPEHAETSTDRTAETNDPTDVALEIALESARDPRVCELIREALQYRECITHEASDEEVRDAVPACGGGK